MGAASIIWNLYQNSGPALQGLLILLLVVGWKHHLEPRLDDLEATQADRGDELQERALSAQERDILLDNAHERINQVDQAVARLKRRLRAVEQAYAAQHGQGDTDLDTDLDLDGPADGPSQQPQD